MNASIQQSESGFFCVALKPCTVRVVETFLTGTKGTVWLRGHRPNRIVEWWPAAVPLTTSTLLTKCTVRDLTFDIQMSTDEFLQNLGYFEGSAADLYLFDRPVPNTLTLDNVPQDSRARVLRENGLIGHFDLPHAHEVAVLSALRREILETWIETTSLGDCLLS